MAEHHGHHHDHGPAAPSAKGQSRDPVCAMTVDLATAKHRAEYHGVTYYFCCAGCQAKFTAEPTKYLEPSDPGQSRRLRKR